MFQPDLLSSPTSHLTHLGGRRRGVSRFGLGVVDAGCYRRGAKGALATAVGLASPRQHPLLGRRGGARVPRPWAAAAVPGEPPCGGGGGGEDGRPAR